MLPYLRIASVLEEASSEDRSRKVKLAVGLLQETPAEDLPKAVRLLTGALWPPWESLDMRAGPEVVLSALREISSVELPEALGGDGVGDAAEAALRRRSQRPISSEPLDILTVYEGLRRFARQKGEGSERRKAAILKGLFLEATPREARYISRMAVGGLSMGIGPRAVLSALSQALKLKEEIVLKAYRLVPDLGLTAQVLIKGGRISFEPPRPVRPMIITQREERPEGLYLIRHRGLRVQAHLVRSQLHIYSQRMRDLTPAMGFLSKSLEKLGCDLALEGELLCLQEEKLLDRAEVVRYVNRRHLSRRSSVLPALDAQDLLYLDGRSLLGMPYQERLDLLISVLGEAREVPSPGAFTTHYRYLTCRKEIEDYYRHSLISGLGGLIYRDPKAPYSPGTVSKVDHYLAPPWEILKAVALGAEYGPEGIVTRVLLGIGQEGNYADLGWARSDLKGSEALSLIRALERRKVSGSDGRMDVSPGIVLKVLIKGARKYGNGYKLRLPRIKGILDSALEEADGPERLENICHRS